MSISKASKLIFSKGNKDVNCGGAPPAGPPSPLASSDESKSTKT